jgi:AraC-like DNA-binding protein
LNKLHKKQHRTECFLHAKEATCANTANAIGKNPSRSKRQRLRPLYRRTGVAPARLDHPLRRAQQLFLSPNYFGDLVRELTGDSATSHIRRFLMQRAQQILLSGASITETAESLGFDYPQHFTRIFKKHFGETPSEYINKYKFR